MRLLAGWGGTMQWQSCHKEHLDVQSIRTSQTTDPWAKQTRPIWPCTKFG